MVCKVQMQTSGQGRRCLQTLFLNRISTHICCRELFTGSRTVLRAAGTFRAEANTSCDYNKQFECVRLFKKKTEKKRYVFLWLLHFLTCSLSSESHSHSLPRACRLRQRRTVASLYTMKTASQQHSPKQHKHICFWFTKKSNTYYGRQWIHLVRWWNRWMRMSFQDLLGKGIHTKLRWKLNSSLPEAGGVGETNAGAEGSRRGL